MRDIFIRILEIIFVGGSYILLHELGHFLFATMLGLNPSFVIGQRGSDITGFALLSIGVTYSHTSLLNNILVILGSTALPLVAAIIFFFIGLKKKSESLMTIAEIYLIFVIFNLLPIGGINSDGYKLWKVFRIA